MSGYVYIAEQRDLMPHHLQMGVTDDIKGLTSRIAELVPDAKVYSYSCRDMQWMASQIAICSHRCVYSAKNMVYTMDTYTAIGLIGTLLAEDATRV